MRQVPLDDDLRAKLGDLEDEIALIDADGRVLAYVMRPDEREMMYDMAAALLDDAEPVDALREYKAGRFKTSAEVFARLKSLELSKKQKV